MHPTLPLLAVAVGERRFLLSARAATGDDDDSDSSSSDSSASAPRSSLPPSSLRGRTRGMKRVQTRTRRQAAPATTCSR